MHLILYKQMFIICTHTISDTYYWKNNFVNFFSKRALSVFNLINMRVTRNDRLILFAYFVYALIIIYKFHFILLGRNNKKYERRLVKRNSSVKYCTHTNMHICTLISIRTCVLTTTHTHRETIQTTTVMTLSIVTIRFANLYI